jgi:hypothetical protein
MSCCASPHSSCSQQSSMRLKTDQFCALATSPAWHAWLHSFNQDLFKDLATHLGKRSSCKANSDKMIALLEQIQAIPDGEVQLEGFLRRHSPHVLLEDEPQEVPVIPSGVFGHYDPELLTVPRRLVIPAHTQQDAAHRAEEFLKGKIYADSIVLPEAGQWAAYIEFLPPEMNILADKIPVENWRIRAYRAKTNQ